MLPIVEQLLVLQDRDRRLLQLKAELTRIPQEIAAVDARVSDETSRLESVRSEYKALESERKKLEIDAESKRAQVLKYRGQLTQIKSNVEYQALLKEIANHEAGINEVEDRELVLMEQVEKIQPRLKEEQEMVKAVTAKAEVDKKSLAERAEKMKVEVAQVETERADLASKCESDVLARYERLMRSKGDFALVPIRHGNCGGCHLNLPAQVAHDAHFGKELVGCQYCGRILYWPADS
jgi:hypothetical protein